ncbi:MAG: hypothetical protein M0021_17455 [Clostridia bacterium]|nr:hypothetical protein [Clostridia bacterium]
MRTPYRNKRKKPPLLPAVQVDGKPVCPGCRMRDKAVIISYGLAHELQVSGSGNQNPGGQIPGDQNPAPCPSFSQLALDDYLGEVAPPGKYKFIARCERCCIRFHYTKDV